MKIEGKPPNGAAGAGDAPRKNKARGAGDRGFAGKLQKQKAAKTGAEETPDSAALSAGRREPSNTPVFRNDEAVTGTSSVAAPLPVQGLVKEIQVRVEPNGPADVEIEFESQVFEGLRVNISKEGGEVAIRFTAASESGAHFLSRHIPSLGAALAAKGIAVSNISMNAGSGSNSRSSKGQGGGGASGGQRKRK